MTEILIKMVATRLMHAKHAQSKFRGETSFSFSTNQATAKQVSLYMVNLLKEIISLPCNQNYESNNIVAVFENPYSSPYSQQSTTEPQRGAKSRPAAPTKSRQAGLNIRCAIELTFAPSAKGHCRNLGNHRFWIKMA